jgi:drug/metabolite transporter (DMT)-like permease
MQTKRRDVEAVGGGLVALAALQFGVVVVLGKLVERTGLPVASMLGVRFGIAALGLGVTLWALRQPLLPARGERGRLALLGLIGYAAESSLFFLALNHGQAAAVTLLFFTYPVFVALASIALGRGAPGWLLGGSLVCAVSGASIVVASTGGLAIRPFGVVLAVSAAVTFTAYLLGVDHVMKRTNALAGSMWVSGFAAIGLVVFALMTGNADVPSGGVQWARLAGMGAGTAGAFVALFVGLRRLGPVRTSIVSAMEPLAATVLAALFLSEPIRAGVAAGGILILAGAVAASLARATPSREPPVP